MGQHTIAFFSSRFSERKITRRSPQYHHRSVAAPSPTPTNVLLLPATSSPCHAVSPNSSPASVALQHGRPPASVALKHGRPHPQSADRPLHCSSAAHQRVALQLRRPARSATPHCTAAPPPAGSSMPVALQLPAPVLLTGVLHCSSVARRELRGRDTHAAWKHPPPPTRSTGCSAPPPQHW